MKRGSSRTGQVAVEFIMMFVLVISIIVYAFYFAVSFVGIHYRSYQVFMIGRAVLASAKTYGDKLTNANAVKDMYDKADSIQLKATSNLYCNLDASNGFRHIMNYGFPSGYQVLSDAGIACTIEANFLLPGLVTKSNGNKLQLAIESMTGSEISDDHSKCAADPGKTWKECLSGNVQMGAWGDNGF